MSANPLGINIPLTVNVKEALGDLKGAKADLSAEIKEIKSAIKDAKDAGDQTGVAEGKARLDTLAARRQELADKIKTKKQVDAQIKNTLGRQLESRFNQAQRFMRGGITLGDVDRGAQLLGRRMVTAGLSGRMQGTAAGRGLVRAGAAISRGGQFLTAAAAKVAGPIAAVAAVAEISRRVSEAHFMGQRQAAEAQGAAAEQLKQLSLGGVFAGGLGGSALADIQLRAQADGRRMREAYIGASLMEYTKNAFGLTTPDADKAAADSVKRNIELQRNLAELGPKARKVTIKGIMEDPAFIRRFGTFRPIIAADDELGLSELFSSLFSNDPKTKNLRVQAEKRRAQIIDGMIQSRRDAERLRRENPMHAFNDQNFQFEMRAQERQSYELSLQWNPY